MGSSVWPSGLQTSQDRRQVALTRARALIDSTLDHVEGDEFGTDKWYRNAGASGTITPTITKKGGVSSLSTTATNARTAILMPSGTIVEVDNPQTSKWYLVARFSVTSAVDAQANCDLRLTATTPGAPEVILGVDGAQSTGFFSYRVRNNAGTTTANAVTSVAVDTNMHLWEMWNDGVNINFAIDGVTLASTAIANAGTNPVAPAVEVSNGTTAAARTIDLDYLYICTGAPA